MQKNKVLAILLFISFGFTGPLLSQDEIPEDFCISGDELKLYNLINEYRQTNGLDEVPLSKNLCYVAKLHVSDLNYNRPDTANCNLHSWSDQGHWAECCYGREKFNNTCMTSKPRELTSYPGPGYEIAFWESVDAIPEIVLELWKSSTASNDLILNRDLWKEKQWNAFGVGMLNGYAVVWFGAEPDVDEGVKVCSTGKMAGRLIDKVKISQDENKNGGVRYYLIISSFKDEASAKSEVARYKSRGFRNPSVVESGDNFRVSLGNYASQEEAVNAKKSLNEKYKNAWILKQ
jgi:hypothetical protein